MNVNVSSSEVQFKTYSFMMLFNVEDLVCNTSNNTVPKFRQILVVSVLETVKSYRLTVGLTVEN